MHKLTKEQKIENYEELIRLYTEKSENLQKQIRILKEKIQKLKTTETEASAATAIGSSSRNPIESLRSEASKL